MDSWVQTKFILLLKTTKLGLVNLFHIFVSQFEAVWIAGTVVIVAAAPTLNDFQKPYGSPLSIEIQDA